MPDLDADQDDLIVLGQVAQGDRLAFDDFVRRHQASLLRFIHTLTTDAGRAEDALQETCLAIWQHAASFRGEASVKSWIFSIARHAVARQFRRGAAEPAPEDHEPLDAIGAAAGWGHDDPETAAMRSEARETVHRALAALSADDRRLLTLRELEGLTGAQAAGVLGLSLAAEKSRLHRARLRFMAALRREVSHAR